MDISPHTIDLINRFIIREYRTDLDAMGSMKIVDTHNESAVFIESIHKQYPGLIRVVPSKNGCDPKIISYHLICEKPNRQIASYWMGRGISNLAEIKEWSGRLYSRYAPSYEIHELPHQEPAQSQMGLWLHDCLTEDFDHDPLINRATLPGGVVVSYDFGMAFSHPYFPPFYTFELGIDDEKIIEQRSFLLGLLSKYAETRMASEQEYLASVSNAFPSVTNPDLCRYYFRNFQTYIFKRIRLSRFFEKIRYTPFSNTEVEKLLQHLNIPATRMNSWDDIQKQLSKLSKNQLDLKGLNLSGADLRKARFMKADLREVNFRGADLRHANMQGADLRGTDLREADLRGAAVDESSLQDALT